MPFMALEVAAILDDLDLANLLLESGASVSICFAVHLAALRGQSWCGAHPTFNRPSTDLSGTMNEWLAGWMITYWLAGWLVDYLLACWLAEYLAGCLVGWLAGWRNTCMAGLLAG